MDEINTENIYGTTQHVVFVNRRVMTILVLANGNVTALSAAKRFYMVTLISNDYTSC